MVNFTCEKITDHILRIRGLGDACMYFLAGSERGILVDTAYGVGDLRGYIESIYHKPYDVVITHGHADHANGMAQWDEVYMNHKDIEVSKIKTDIGLRRTMLARSVKDIDSYPDSEFQPAFTGTFLPLEDGQIFDLGNIHVEAIYAPGHTQGMMTLLVKEERIMLFGDACGVCTFLFKPESSNVLTYKETLMKLKARSGEYDRILRQHGTCESPMSLVDENLEVADEILNGTDDHVPFEYLGEHVWLAKKMDPISGRRADGKDGNIVYAMDKIR